MCSTLLCIRDFKVWKVAFKSSESYGTICLVKIVLLMSEPYVTLFKKEAAPMDNRLLLVLVVAGVLLGWRLKVLHDLIRRKKRLTVVQSNTRTTYSIDGFNITPFVDRHTVQLPRGVVYDFSTSTAPPFVDRPYEEIPMRYAGNGKWERLGYFNDGQTEATGEAAYVAWDNMMWGVYKQWLEAGQNKDNDE